MVKHLIVAVFALSRRAERAHLPAREQSVAISRKNVRGRQPKKEVPANLAEGCAARMVNPERHRLRLFAYVGVGDLAFRLYSGLIRLHILHHAAKEPIFGFGMIEELARHGYRISPGTLYPLLRGLEKKGCLRSSEHRNGKSRRIVFRATPLGRKALNAAKQKVRELFGELIDGNYG
jgi:PadR family transcriptional regulator, regulatory protein PadR